jgi:hypothetical protein
VLIPGVPMRRAVRDGADATDSGTCRIDPVSDAVQIAIITGLTTGVPSLLGMWFAFLARKNALDAANVSRETQAIAQKTESNTNHMKDELVALTAKSSHAEGKLEGKAEEKAKEREQ